MHLLVPVWSKSIELSLLDLILIELYFLFRFLSFFLPALDFNLTPTFSHVHTQILKEEKPLYLGDLIKVEARTQVKSKA